MGSPFAGPPVGGYHYEEPFLPYWFGICDENVRSYDCTYDHALDWLAGLGTAIIGGIIAVVAYRFGGTPPTVRCEDCGGRGWITDLEPTGGSCPRCGHRRFRYRAVGAVGVPMIRLWRLDDADGGDLLAIQVQNENLR